MLSIFNKWKSSSKLVKWSSIIILLIIISLTIFLPIYFLVIKKSDKSDKCEDKCPGSLQSVYKFLRNEDSVFNLNTKELKIKLLDNTCNCVEFSNSNDENYCDGKWMTQTKLIEPCGCDTNRYCINNLTKIIKKSKETNKRICGIAIFKHNCKYLRSKGEENEATIENVSISNNNEVIIKFNKLASHIKTIDDIFPMYLQIALECEYYDKGVPCSMWKVNF